MVNKSRRMKVPKNKTIYKTKEMGTARGLTKKKRTGKTKTEI